MSDLAGPQPDSVAPLFRQPAIDHLARGLGGELVISRPVPLNLLFWLASLVFGLFVAAVFMVEIPESVASSGKVVPQGGVVDISSPRPGTVSAVNVRAGQIIKAGTVMFVIADQRRRANGASVQEAVTLNIQARKKILAGERDRTKLNEIAIERGFADQLGILNKQMRNIESQIALGMEKLQAAELDLEVYRQYLGKGYLSEAGFRAKKSIVLDIALANKALESSRLGLEQSIAAIAPQKNQALAALSANLSVHEQTLATYDQEQIESEFIQSQPIIAPVDGLVSSVLVRPGEATPATQLLSVLIPDRSRMEIQLFVPEKAVSFIEVGALVSLRFRAFPHQLYGPARARVRSVSASPAMDDNGAPATGPRYLIVADLASTQVQRGSSVGIIRAGMVADLNIAVEKQTLAKYMVGLFRP
jgi:membrane fusion protein